jgi:organic hydroperoxide reductase OsmC/OhrA
LSEYIATVSWRRGEALFTDNRYSRAHTWIFDGGAEVPASASPHAVRPPFSDPAGVDPEEAFVASLSSCHMLWFLSLAAKEGFAVDSYVDSAIGKMEEDAEGKLAITRVTLRPEIVFSGNALPSGAQIAELHHLAHESCYIASSVKTEVVVEQA